MSAPERRTRMLDRLEQLVSIETPTGDEAGLSTAQALVRSWLDPLVGPGESIVIDGVSHLLWRGGSAPRVLLLGHLDTVFPVGTLKERPFTVDGERATGPGVFDMKAGVVIIAEVLALIRAPGAVSVLLTSDEEIGSVTSRSLVEAEAGRAGKVLVFEPSLDGAVKVARRGGSLYRLGIRGREAHAGLEPWEGRSALSELAHHVLALPGLADAELGTTVSPTVARAGSAVNVIPGLAELQIDVRAWTLAELQRVDAAMAVLEPHTPDVALTVSGGINRPPMEEAAAADLLQVAREVATRLGSPEVVAVSAGGASDGNFAAAVGASTLDGLGPDGAGAHAAHESVSVASMLERVDLVVGLVDELA